MTTIVSNGYYLLADHRQALSVPAHMAYTSRETGEKDACFENDKVVKIHLIPDDAMIRSTKGQKLRAIALCGNTYAMDPFMELCMNVKEGVKVSDLQGILSMIGAAVPESEAEIVAVTDDFYTETYLFTGAESSHEWEINLYEPGKFKSFGSGSQYIDEMTMSPEDSPSLRGAMAIAAFHDEHTSPTYSVYGNAENILFVNVDEGPDAIMKLYADEAARFKKAISEWVEIA